MDNNVNAPVYKSITFKNSDNTKNICDVKYNKELGLLIPIPTKQLNRNIPCAYARISKDVLKEIITDIINNIDVSLEPIK